jgi:hypothetical protein
LDSLFFARLLFGHFKGAQIPASHQMTAGMLSSLWGRQSVFEASAGAL